MSAAPRPTVAPSTLVMNLGIGLLCLIWGSTWLVIREGLADLPPFTSAGVRFSVAAAAMFALAPWLRRLEGGEPPRASLWIATGVLNFGVSYGVVYWSEQVLPSGLVSVLWAVYPMMMAGLGHLYLPGERLVARQWLGFVIGFLGVAFLVGADPAGIGPESLSAALILMISPAACAVGTLVVKRWGTAQSSVLLNRNGMTLGAVLLLLVAWLTESGAEPRWTATAISSIAYLSIVGTVVTFSMYYWLLRFAPANRLSLIAYVTPPVALFLGWGVGDERLTAKTLVGAAGILAGVILVVRQARAGGSGGPASEDDTLQSARHPTSAESG